jgi:transposase-like protein
MRYPASEKLEIIRLVEQSHLPARHTLDKLGIAKTTFYRWYDRYSALGMAGLEDRSSGPGRIWNRIPDEVRRQIVDLALEKPDLSPRELAVTFTDEHGYFVSEASVYRLLKAHDLITSPASSSSKRPTSSTTRRRHPTSSGRPTSPTSRSSAGAGSICRRSSTTTRATLSPGSYAQP